MKKMMKTWAVVAAAAMGLTACQNDFEEQIEVKDTVVVSFVADSAESRTSVDTTGEKPLFTWGAEESFAVLEQTDALAQATAVGYENVDGKAHITAEFAANTGKSDYKYATVYPASGFVSASSLESATLTLPAEQTMAEGSYDPNADLMVSEVVTAAAQPTEAQLVRFTRVAAVAKMSLKNFGLELGDKLESVTFTAEGKNLAGSITANLANVAEENGFEVSEGSSSVTVKTTSAADVYFTLLPTTLEAGDSYTITILTEKYLYVKKGTIPEGRELAFEAGMVSRFGVDMNGVAPSEKWVLVRDASTLKQGDVVAIAAKNYNVVMGKQGGNYPVAAKVEAVKLGDYLYHPITTTVDDMIQPLTLMKRDNERIAFDFYNGVDYDGDTSVGFVYATGSNYSPKIQGYCDVNTLFDVTITDGVATITATDIEKSYKYWRYSHSNTVSSRKFDMTNSVITNENNMLCIYKLEGAVGTIPVVAAHITVPDADESVVIAEEGAAGATAISEVVFNYVGDWAITATSEATWLTSLNFDKTKNQLTYTAEANTGVKRETTVTIKATLEGQESLTWTFNVVQKGVPMEISIADFMTKGQDVNATYKITGRITEMTSSSSGTYKLTDGTNVATVTYLYTDGGDKVYGDDSIGVAVGDVMTVTTVVTTSTKGKGGSSTYHSIYKGHYGFKVSSGVAAGYLGGEVTIDVNTYSNGSIVVPDAVVATMEESDFAELSYSGGDKATVTFTSENTTSDAREATVTFTYGETSVAVTVQQGVNPANKKGYELVTDASTLAIGDEVIIVAKNADKAIACPTSTSATSFPAAAIEKTGNVVYDVEEAGVQVFTLGQGVSEGTMSFDFTYKDTGYRLYYSSGLKMRSTSYAVNAATSWTIEIAKEDGDATITSTRLIKFNSTTGTTFTCYASTNANATKAENAVCIYKKQK